MADKTLYTKDSIKSISPREFTRLHPGTYCGSTEYSTQLLRELFANSLDEHNIGHGNLIEIFIDTKINNYQIRDYGQGFPVNQKTSEGTTILEDAFSRLNTSGKYDENGVYGASALGMNGIGSKLPTYLSKILTVSSSDGKGQSETIIFEDGIFKSRTLKKEQSGKSGTTISYIPDPQFFQHPEVNMKEIEELFVEISALCPSLTINLTVDDKTKEFHSSNGLSDLITSKTKGKEIISNRFISHKTSGDNLFDICLTYTSDYSDNIISYVNYGKTDGGVHLTALKTALTRNINSYAQANNLFKKGDENLSGNELSEGLVIAFNLKANGVQYDSQSKTRVTAIDRSLITETINNDFVSWMERNPKDIKMIIEKALSARKAADAAKKAREAARKPAKGKGLKAKMQLSDKFIDCINKNPKDRNLLLVEGLSAGSSAIEARNVQTDCIYMLRGKTVSPLKTTVDKLLANQEISDIIKVIGAGFGKDFDVDKMNFDKIVITSDQDSDGASIELLLTTFFYTYMKPLVLEGKLYRAVTPLYIVRQRGKEFYFYSDKEFEDWKAEHGTPTEIVRAKGLGELNPTDLKAVCFENQRFKRITVSDIEASTKLLETLMGKAVAPRKQYIYDNAKQLGFNFQ